MASLRLRALWRKLDRLISEALALERTRIGDGQAELVQEYLDHNELGLAYETLIDALVERDLAPLDTSRPPLDEARRLMNLDDRSSATPPQ